MRYKPERDIPKAVRELKTVSPSQIRDWVRDHRTKTDARGKREQEDITDKAISMWFKRHPEEKAKLEAELKDEQLDKATISESIFENGVFYEIPVIATWNRDMTNRGVKEDTRKRWVGMIKRVCKGNIAKRPKTINIEGWGLRHPRRLNIDDAKDFLYELTSRKIPAREWKLALRNFFNSRGIVVKSTDISGELEESAGQYADLYVSREKIYAILDAVKIMNLEAYLASLFGYKTATRITATLNADSQYLNREEHTLAVFEKSQARKKKKKVTKYIPPELWEMVKDRKGKLFSIDETELNQVLRTAYKAVIPDIEPRIKMPFHFWRHMFAQHMLRKERYNTTLVANLGNWTTQALEKYYGKMPFSKAIELGAQSVGEL